MRQATWALALACLFAEALAKCTPLRARSLAAAAGLRGGVEPEPVVNASAATPKKKKKSKKSRKKILSQEGRSRKRKSRGGGSTNIDFSEASIDGARRTPAGVALSTSKQDQEFDLIKLRTRWHDEMKHSTTNLETGRGR